MKLVDFVNDMYLPQNPQIGHDASNYYRCAVRQLEAFAGRRLSVCDLSEGLIGSFMRWLRDHGREARTINNKRTQLLALWRQAFDAGLTERLFRRVPKLPEPRRNPRAWTPEDVGRILDACRQARTLDGWCWWHWQALVGVCYDSGERIGALLETPLAALDRGTGVLTVPAAARKTAEDHVAHLHGDTVALVERTLDQPREPLFPWPLCERAIWPEFRRILVAAGLPATKRDLFHRLRRTGYTQVYAAQGLQAAAAFAGHRTDMSRHYLDRTLLPEFDARDVLPRPGRKEDP